MAAIATFLILGATGFWMMEPTESVAEDVKIELPEKATEFGADSAHNYLTQICKIGTRITSSNGMKKQQELLKAHFEHLGATVEMQPFQFVVPSQRNKRVNGQNMIIHWHPDAKKRILIGAHYDTRPIADQEPIYRNRSQPFLGANDGASGVAFLMELGRMMPLLDLKIGVDFAFFDAEECVFQQGSDKYCLGSKYMANEYARNRKRKFNYEAVIVVDMIGDKDLVLHPDERSSAKSGRLVREIWGIANELKVTQFNDEIKYDLTDDHVSFLDVGLPAVDIIDFDYPYWHRLSDTPDKCSGESLAAVSKVIVEWLKRQK